MSPSARRSGAPAVLTPLKRGLLVLLAATAAIFGPLAPALAHGDGESAEGYALVQQAIGHLVHDSGHEGIMLAKEKVDDALDTEDQEGVNVSELQDAAAALEAGDAARARTLLQDSIAEAMAALPPAKGEETGTTVVDDALTVSPDLTGLGRLLLLTSIVIFVAGVWLSWRFRPQDTVGALRERLGGTAPRRPRGNQPPKSLQPPSPSKEA